MRTKRRANPEAKLRQVYDVGYNFRLQAKLTKDIDQVRRRHDQHVHSAEQWPGATESAQVIAGFPAVIVQQHFLPSQPCHQPGGNWCNQKRPIGCGKNVRDISLP